MRYILDGKYWLTRQHNTNACILKQKLTSPLSDSCPFGSPEREAFPTALDLVRFGCVRGTVVLGAFNESLHVLDHTGNTLLKNSRFWSLLWAITQWQACRHSPVRDLGLYYLSPGSKTDEFVCVPKLLWYQTHRCMVSLQCKSTVCFLRFWL